MDKRHRAGLAILILYVTVAMATIALSGRHVRPLFEGIGPSAPYQWVKPPPLFAPGNVVPKPFTIDILVADMGNPSQFGTADGQFLLNVPAHGLTTRSGEQSVRFVLTPADPADLGPLPAGLRPAGNAYRVAFTYQPGGADASPLAVPGNVRLVLPEPVKSFVYSPDGHAWQTLPDPILQNATAGVTTFRAEGWYLGAADAATAAPGQLAGQPSNGKRLSTVLVAALVVGLTAALVGIPAMIRRRPRRGATAGARSGTRRPRPGQKPKRR